MPYVSSTGWSVDWQSSHSPVHPSAKHEWSFLIAIKALDDSWITWWITWCGRTRKKVDFLQMRPWSLVDSLLLNMLIVVAETVSSSRSFHRFTTRSEKKYFLKSRRLLCFFSFSEWPLVLLSVDVSESIRENPRRAVADLDYLGWEALYGGNRCK